MSNFEIVALFAATVIGAGGIGSVVSAWATKRKVGADALATLEPIVAGWLDRLGKRVEELEEEVDNLTERLRSEERIRRSHEALLHENGISFATGTDPAH